MNAPDHRSILHGDVLERLTALPDSSVDTVVTSPPYWALRDYEESDQWGMEHHYGEYLARLGRLMEALSRIVKPTGSVWINLGDCYADSGKGASQFEDSGAKESWHPKKRPSFDYDLVRPRSRCAIPERFMIDTIDAGWVLRNDVIWHKSSSLPSSVKNRLTNKYEHLYFFTREPSGYYFDLDAIRVPSKTFTRPPAFDKRPPTEGVQQSLFERDSSTPSQPDRKSTRIDAQNVRKHNGEYNPDGTPLNHPAGKNPGDVQSFTHKTSDASAGTAGSDLHRRQEQNQMKATDFNHPAGKNPGDVQDFVREDYPGLHFAVFPPALVEWVLSAACPVRVCGSCGTPHFPVSVPSPEYRRQLASMKRAADRMGGSTPMRKEAVRKGNALGRTPHASPVGGYIRAGYEQGCKCKNAPTEPGIVLDPFMGAGTTALAAERLNRRWTGIELSQDYIDLARKRLAAHRNEPLPV